MEFGTFDIEATQWINAYLLGRFDGKDYQYFKGKTLIADYLDWELSEPLKIAYAHNGGKYDFKFLLKHILLNRHKNNLVVKPLFVNGSIISMKIYRKSKTGKTKKLIKEFRDSFVLMPSSLKELCRSFDVKHKKLDMTDEDYDDNTITPEKLKYLEYDCKGLYECIEKFIEFSEIDGIVPLTISSTAMQIFINKFQPDFSKIICNMRCIEPDIRKGYYGGRVEVIRRYGEILKYYDVNSLYPFAMHKKRYPTGTFIEVQKMSDNLLGIYECDIIAPDNHKILLLPCRTENGLVFGSGKFSGWYTTPEIEKAMSIGYQIRIKKGYVWTDYTDDLYTDYVDYFYEKKRNSTGGKRYISKTYLNGLYGRFAMRRDRKKIMFSVDENDLYDVDVLDDELGIYAKDYIQLFSNTIRPILSIYTTAYARLHLYSILEQVGFYHVYYMDTDSVITDKELPISGQLGSLKLEHNIKRGIFLQPKLYGFINDKDEAVLRAKGFYVNDLKYSDYENALFKNDYSGFEQNRNEVLGFLESLRRRGTDKILAAVNKTKTNKGLFTKRVLIDDYDTEPIKL